MGRDSRFPSWAAWAGRHRGKRQETRPTSGAGASCAGCVERCWRIGRPFHQRFIWRHRRRRLGAAHCQRRGQAGDKRTERYSVRRCRTRPQCCGPLRCRPRAAYPRKSWASQACPTVTRWLSRSRCGQFAPGQSDTFTVQLNTDTPGTFAGDISIPWSAISYFSYSFGVTGTVTTQTEAEVEVDGLGTQNIVCGAATANATNGTDFGSAFCRRHRP